MVTTRLLPPVIFVTFVTFVMLRRHSTRHSRLPSPVSRLSNSAGQERIDDLPDGVADEIEPDNGGREGDADNDGVPGIVEHVALGAGEHGAPRRRRWLGAETEKAEPRFVEDGVGDAEGAEHGQRRDAAGQNGAPQNRHVARTHHP